MDKLYFFILGVTAFFGILTSVLVVYFAVKYRDERPAAGRCAHHRLDPARDGVVADSVPVAMVIFVWAHSVFFHIFRPPDQTLNIYSTGKRWMWQFQHLDGQREINELHVPVGRAVKVTFTSEDVLHALYFPAFRAKADAIPGRYSTIWFNATKVGRVPPLLRGVLRDAALRHDRQGPCHGAGRLPGVAERLRRGRHAGLRAANSSSASSRATPAIVKTAPGAGRRWWTNSAARNGWPTGRSSTSTRRYVRESILMPQLKLVDGYQPVMPTFQGLVNEEGVMALIEYVKSLQTSSGGPSTAANTAAPPAAAPAQENR